MRREELIFNFKKNALAVMEAMADAYLYLKGIDDQGWDASGIMDRMIDFVSSETAKIDSFDLVDIIEVMKMFNVTKENAGFIFRILGFDDAGYAVILFDAIIHEMESQGKPGYFDYNDDGNFKWIDCKELNKYLNHEC